MSLWQLASRSLRHFWRTNLALLLGIGICTAVLTGALIVGDSIRASLKSLTIQRLGRIDEILLSDHFFGAELATALRANPAVAAGYAEVIPAILLNQTTIEVDGVGLATTRMQGVTVLGCDTSFWDLDTAGSKPQVLPSANQIVINQSVAAELGVAVGQRLLLRVGKSGGIGADSPLANKDDLVQTVVDLEIVDIIPARGLGRFSLQVSQQASANAFVSLATLQQGLDQQDNINAIFVAGRDAEQPASADAFASLRAALQPQLGDLGLTLKRVNLQYQSAGKQISVAEYDQLGSSQMLFAPEADPRIEAALQGKQAQPVFTYLATRLDKLNAAGAPVGDVVPYSTISGVDSVGGIGPVVIDHEPIQIADDAIVLNRWAADQLQANVGDRIRVTYFEPESTHGETVEQSADLKLQAIVEITTPSRPFTRRSAAEYDQPPTLATDPDLTPEVPGITDKGPISQWDAPFPINYDLLKPRDDQYGDFYRTMPKAFVSLRTSRRLWHSRFGQTTSYRLPVVGGVSTAAVASELASQLGKHAEAFGLNWIRAKTDGLRASAGTTPFDALFLGFSMFIIAAALVLVSLLLRLSLEQRATQIGLLASLGFDWKRNLRVLLLENATIVLLGSVVGVVLGVGYAWLMLMGLRTWWVAAVVTPFMELSLEPLTLAVGGTLGIVASLLTIALTLRRLRKISASRLLSGKTDEDDLATVEAKRRGWWSYAPWALFIVAMCLDLLAPRLAPEPQAGAFFGSGACVLVAILLLISSRLRRAAVASPDCLDLTLQSLAARNLTRNPARSTLTIGLVASACFLIVAISAFRLAPTEEGTGGFELVGQSDQPIFADLRDPIELRTRFKDEAVRNSQVFALRMQDGDDASCRNLYRTARPRLIGITQAFRQGADAIGKLEWAGVDRNLAAGRPAWDVLAGDLPMDKDVIPVVLDKNTAMYSLQLYGGVGEEFQRDYGPAGTLTFRVVGLLAGSIFQGSLLIPDEELLKHFPRVSGFRYFLVDCPERSTAVAAALEEQFSNEGLDLTDTRRLLTELLAVQNTYLSTFQSLGGLGLLLGTFGLAAVQLRNVIQRRGELALLRATGYRNDQLSMLLLREHVLLLFGGLVVGVVAAAVVVFPHMLFGGASIPIVSLIFTLGLVAIVGLASAVLAQRYLSQTPLLPALRGD